LNQAIMNLVANSADAIEDGGRIRVTGRAVEDSYVLVVADSGAGVPAELRQRIFEPFFTTKSIGKGTGLGLSITYSIVTKHGGTIRVDCPPEGGTAMTMTLPLIAPGN
jgi:two-component system NtrC family sensor kinase